MDGLALPDKRFNKSIISVTEHISDYAGSSFSSACGALLRKSAWRLFSSDELNLLSTHQKKTMERCAGLPIVLVAEDTTDVFYRQKGKSGMGDIGGAKSKGLNIHTGLALSADGAALGIVSQKIWAPKGGRRNTKRYKFPIEEKETIKWIETLRSVNAQWSEQQQTVVLVADREADFFEHFAQPRAPNVELLIRVQQKTRNILYYKDNFNISELLQQLKPLGTGSVKVWRKPSQPQRQATVAYYCAEITIPPTYKQTLEAQKMNLIYIKEDGAIKDAIEWILLTTLPVTTLEEAMTISGYYAKRWIVERFHLILKSGLGIEKIQIDSFKRLYNALQVYSVVGWHLLSLYRLGQYAPDDEAAKYFDSNTIEILNIISHTEVKTNKDLLIEIGKIGGFIPTKKQPLPGEKTLWIGVMKFIAMKKGFDAAKERYGTG